MSKVFKTSKTYKNFVPFYKKQYKKSKVRGYGSTFIVHTNESSVTVIIINIISVFLTRLCLSLSFGLIPNSTREDVPVP